MAAINEPWFNNGVARPRTITDERMLTAAGAVVARLGPAFTLADVAGQARVATGTLVQRFGSKHGLLVALTRAAIASTEHDLRAVADQADDPVAALTRALVRRYAPLDDPAAAANNLGQLAVDLADPELRGLLAELHAVTEAALRPLLSRAVAAGALPGAPPVPVAARVLAALADGAALRWSARPAGSLGPRLRADLDAVLAGWRRVAARSSGGPVPGVPRTPP
jgi:AcrR family transcriptional regulator